MATGNTLNIENLTPASAAALGTAANQTHVMEFRLSGSGTNPVGTGSALTTLHMTPFTGNLIALYNGATWDVLSSASINIAVPATTDTLYDVFCYNNAGTATLELLAWTNDTTRATALTTQDGVLVKTGDATRRWIGCMRTGSVSGQTVESTSFRMIYNFYNQVQKFINVAPADATWTYASYATWRPANSNTSTNQIGIVTGAPLGYQSNVVNLQYQIMSQSNGANVTVIVGISKDGVDPAQSRGFGASLTTAGVPAYAAYSFSNEATGYHYFLPYEYLSGSTDTVTFSKTIGIVTGSFRGFCLG